MGGEEGGEGRGGEGGGGGGFKLDGAKIRARGRERLRLNKQYNYEQARSTRHAGPAYMFVPLRVLTLRASFYTYLYSQVYIYQESYHGYVGISTRSVHSQTCLCPCQCSHLDPLCIHANNHKYGNRQNYGKKNVQLRQAAPASDFSIIRFFPIRVQHIPEVIRTFFFHISWRWPLFP